MSDDYYREIRHLSFGNENINKDEILLIKNTLIKELLALKINNGIFDVKKYISQIIILELDKLEKNKIYSFNELDLRAKIFKKFKIIKKNILIIYTDFLHKENLFTFNYFINFFNKLQSLLDRFGENDKLDINCFINLFSQWNILERILLEYQSIEFKYQYEIAVKEIKKFLIFVCFEYEKKEKYFFNFFKILFALNLNNDKINERNINMEELKKNTSKIFLNFNLNIIFDYFKINKFFLFFSNDYNQEIILNENIFNLINEYFIIFNNFKNLQTVKDQIKIITNVLNSCHIFEEENQTFDLLADVNQFLANSITKLWMKALEYYKSVELNHFIFEMINNVLAEII